MLLLTWRAAEPTVTDRVYDEAYTHFHAAVLLRPRDQRYLDARDICERKVQVAMESDVASAQVSNIARARGWDLEDGTLKVEVS